jgi:hypothetical protein
LSGTDTGPGERGLEFRHEHGLIDELAVSPDDVAVLSYSSGTIGPL